MKIYDVQNKIEVEVPFDRIAPLVSTGQYKLPVGQQIPILNPEGELGEISSDNYVQALQNGYAPATELDVQKTVEKNTYGDSALQTGLERAAGAATFGISDFITSKIAPQIAHDMAKREEYNPTAAIGGEAIGTVGPALLSGGTSLLGKAAAKTGPAIAERIGASVAERAAKATAKYLPKNATAAKIVQEIVPRAAGMGVEGALYGAGNYLSDTSLGTAEQSAESLLSHVGLSGMLGAGLGGAFGAAKLAITPVVKKITGLGDINKIAQEYIGANTAKGQKIFDKGIKESEVANALVNESKIGIKVMDDADEILRKSDDFMQRTGEGIDATLQELAGAGQQILPTSAKLQERMLSKLDELGNAVKNAEGSELAGAADYNAALSKVRAEVEGQFINKAKGSKISVEELQATRQAIDKAAKFDASKPSVGPEIYRELRKVLRESIDEVAAKAGGETAARLKALNRDYHIGASIMPSLEKELYRNARNSTLNLKDIAVNIAAGQITGDMGIAALITGARKLSQNQMAKNAQLIYSLKMAQNGMDKAINDATRNFFIGSGKGVKASTLSLSNSPKEYSEYTKKIDQFASNPEEYLNHVNKRHLALSQEIPNVIAAAESKGLAGMQFLAGKMPRQKTAPGLINRPFVPSTQERAKFMRYAEVVENPKKALQHLQNGTLSRENVEALRSVYPQFYKQLVNTASAQMAKHGDKLPYNKKLQLGLLLGIPADSSMNPTFIQNMQLGFNEQDSAIEPGVTGMQELDKSNRMKYDQGE